MSLDNNSQPFEHGDRQPDRAPEPRFDHAELQIGNPKSAYTQLAADTAAYSEQRVIAPSYVSTDAFHVTAWNGAHYRGTIEQALRQGRISNKSWGWVPDNSGDGEVPDTKAAEILDVAQKAGQSEKFDYVTAAVPRPEDFVKGDWISRKPYVEAFLPEGDTRVGLDHILAKHTLGAKVEPGGLGQGVFNVNDPQMVKDLVKAAVLAHHASETTVRDDGEKRTVYQASITPDTYCGTCSPTEPVGYVHYKSGARVPAYLVDVVVNEKGVVMTAYPSDKPLKPRGAPNDQARL